MNWEPQFNRCTTVLLVEFQLVYHSRITNFICWVSLLLGVEASVEYQKALGGYSCCTPLFKGYILTSCRWAYFPKWPQMGYGERSVDLLPIELSKSIWHNGTVPRKMAPKRQRVLAVNLELLAHCIQHGHPHFNSNFTVSPCSKHSRIGIHIYTTPTTVICTPFNSVSTEYTSANRR
jgi:hypothetical protein